jgi:threonine/homoserine/homoserine lactone efflux protein
MTEQVGRSWLLVVSWLLAAVALLATQGMLVPYLLAVGAATLAWLGLRALIRQQPPSMLERPPLPERYRMTDLLARPLDDVVTVEREAAGRQ